MASTSFRHRLNVSKLTLLLSAAEIVGFKCPEKVTGKAAKFYPFPRYAIPGDCSRSITCVNGFPRIIACGEDKVFDAESLTCDEPELVPGW